jgi:hypothetical protein
LLGSLALVLAVAGQLALTVSPRGLGLGLALSAGAVLMLGWASFRPAARWLASVVGRLGLSHRPLLIGLAAILSALTAIWGVAYEELGRTNYMPVLALLSAGALTYAGAFVNGATLAGWRERLRPLRLELALLGLIVLTAAGLRFILLGDLPRVINGDEGLLGQAALLTRELPLANPFALFENFGALYMQGIAVALAWLGPTPLGLRLLPAIGGTLAVPALYLLGRTLFGPRVGLLAALLLALSHAHIHFSRTVAVGYIQGTWIAPLVLYLFASGLHKRSALRLAVGGLLLGADFMVYLGATILTGFLLVYVLVAAVLCRPLIQSALRPILAFWFGVVLAALPQAVYSWRHPAQLFARLNSEGTLQSGWLAEQIQATGQSAFQVLAARVAHAFLSLIHYPAEDFYGAPAPLLEVATAALFVLGLGVALVKTRDYRYLLLNAYFWAATVAVGVFAIPPSADSYRMLIAVPPAMLLAALGWEQALGAVAPASHAGRLARPALYGALIATVALINLRTYFVDFAGRCRFGGDPQTRFASYLGNFLRPLDREADVYLLSTEELRYGTHSSVDFLSNGLPVVNVDEPVGTLFARPNVVVIAGADRADELRAWARQNPGGSLAQVYDCENLMLAAYQIAER